MAKEQTEKKSVTFNDGTGVRTINYKIKSVPCEPVRVNLNPKRVDTIQAPTTVSPATRAKKYKEELAKTEEVLHRINGKIKKHNVEAVSDAIEYLPRLQSLCAEYSRLLDGAGVEHRGYMDDSIISDLCSRLSDVKYCLEDEKS